MTPFLSSDSHLTNYNFIYLLSNVFTRSYHRGQLFKTLHDLVMVVDEQSLLVVN